MRSEVTFTWEVLTLLITSVSAYPPTCLPIFGKPTSADCDKILRRSPIAHGGSHQNRGASNVFGIAGLERPDGVSSPQWSNKVDIPKFFVQSRYTV